MLFFSQQKKCFFDESKRILLTWTVFKHHQKQKPRGREKNEKRKTQHELLSSYFYFSKQASKAVDSRVDMLTRHKSSWLPDLNLTSKMKPWNTLTAEEEESSGKNINATILQNLSAAFLQFRSFTRITFVEDNINCSNWQKYFENNFFTFEKNSWFEEVFKFSKLTKNERNFCQTKKKQRFWHRMKCLRIAFEDCPKKVKKTGAKFRFSEPNLSNSVSRRCCTKQKKHLTVF